MYCRNCASQIDDKAVVCVHCGVPPRASKKYCSNCGSDKPASNGICTACGVLIDRGKSDKSKLVAGIFALLLGSFGAHKFYLGYTGEGIITIVIFVLGFIFAGVPSVIITIIAIVEGIIYLNKTDEDFESTYLIHRKPWL